MSLTYIGIDNGLDGALVALSDTPGGGIIRSTVMPTRKKAKGREVDAEIVAMWLEGIAPWHDLCIILETPGKHSPGILALCSMWDSYGVLRAICETHPVRHHRVTPQTWQKEMLPGCEKGNTKPFALSVAKRLWPGELFLRTPACEKPHDGLVDAALISEFGRRKQL